MTQTSNKHHCYKKRNHQDVSASFSLDRDNDVHSQLEFQVLVYRKCHWTVVVQRYLAIQDAVQLQIESVEFHEAGEYGLSQEMEIHGA